MFNDRGEAIPKYVPDAEQSPQVPEIEEPPVSEHSFPRRGNNSPKNHVAQPEPPQEAPVVPKIESPTPPKAIQNTPSQTGHVARADRIQEAAASKRNSNAQNFSTPTENYSADEGPVDDITNVSFEEVPKKKHKVARFIVTVIFALLLVLLAIFAFRFFQGASLGGKEVDVSELQDTKVKFVRGVDQKTALNTPKKLTLTFNGSYQKSIPVQNLVVLADGKPVEFKTDEKQVEFSKHEYKLTGEVSGLEKFENNFSVRIMSDQKNILYQSSTTKLTFPFDLAGTAWKVKYRSDVKSPGKTLSIYFLNDRTYEETIETESVKYADTNNVKKWEHGAVTGTIVQGTSDDGSIRYLTNPQSFVETQYLSSYKKGKEPITRLKYQSGQVPEDLNDYRHEIRLKNDRLYFFLPGANENLKTQVFLFEEIRPRDVEAFSKINDKPQIKQAGLTSNPAVASDIRRRILQKFIDQLNYTPTDENLPHFNTIFYDSPNGEQTTGLITYFNEGKDNNLMKFILYRNGRLNVYPLNSGFEVPKAYTLNIYKDIKSDNYKKLPDFKK
ncbi:hypothetical protein XA3_20500 [Xylocopilactobacillus apicola]|uniref:DUF4179 domain-containing protein n=2 Tax=Xylocopilactobacillus apicola TaxID=2932184 RepID=A0AAU9D027_9LACO|nr:hypothetical protein XA3_20500 [Xylocopilactobacillus apicola]